MPIITINTAKPGDEPERIILNVSKSGDDTVKVRLKWGDDTDVDGHAILLYKGKLGRVDHILSAYNLQRSIRGRRVGIIEPNDDGSFSILNGAVNHSGDALTGNNPDVDEEISFDPDEIPDYIDECGIFITIHHKPDAPRVKFRDVKSPTITVMKNDTVVQAYNLSKDFGEFDGVQAVSFLRKPNGDWEVMPVGIGFNGDLNVILVQLSSQSS